MAEIDIELIPKGKINDVLSNAISSLFPFGNPRTFASLSCRFLLIFLHVKPSSANSDPHSYLGMQTLGIYVKEGAEGPHAKGKATLIEEEIV